MTELNITDIIFRAMNSGTEVVMTQPAPFWIKLLALFGGLSIATTLFSQMGNLINGIFYILGFFKWLYEVTIKRKKQNG